MNKNLLRFILIIPAVCALSAIAWAQVYINVNINQPPPLLSNAGTDQTICSGWNTTLGGVTAGGTSPYSYKWSPSANLSGDTAANPLASPLVTTTYTLTVTDVNNCKSMDSVVVIVNTCSGINPLTGSENFRIVPNPNRGSFTVTLPSLPEYNPVSIDIYNPLGKLVLSVSFIEGNPKTDIPIDLSGMTKGLYLVKVLCKNAVFNQHLILE